MIIKSTLVLACAAVALARDAVLSRGIFLGKDTTEPGVTPLEIYKDPVNHATAASSIIRYISEDVKFSPHNASPAELNKVYKDWKYSIVRFKGFPMGSPPMAGDIKLEGGRDKLEEQLKQRIDHIPDCEVLAREVAGMIPDYNDDRDLKVFTLSLLIVDKPEMPMGDDGFFFGGGGGGRRPPHKPDAPRRPKNKVMVRMLTLELQLDTAILFKWVTVPDQQAHITYIELEVDQKFMALHAEGLAEKTTKSMTSVSDLMWYFTSPKKLAFADYRPTFDEQMFDGDDSQLPFVHSSLRHQGDPQLLEWLRL
ncbi:hypothetical protein DFQ26_001745 [Actinomortierella ambigua]|nr:hypothetical protein DFQ26_001745 [Actinomortierella ambigua]